jgi:hypothetical protein
MKYIIFMFTFLVIGCSSSSSVLDGTTGIISGVIKDVSDITTYTLDTASSAVKAATNTEETE